MINSYSQYNLKYQTLIRKILNNGIWTDSRNSLTISLPHYSFTVDDMENDWQLLLRKMNYKGVYGEWITFSSDKPLTNVKQLQDNGCPYWNGFADEDGSINLDYANKLPQQLNDVIEGILSDKTSRRYHIELWDSDKQHREDLNLPCCHHGYTFSIIQDVLHMTWIQRSTDCFLGLPSDVAFAHYMMKHIADRTGLKIGSCMFALSNVHLYENSIAQAKEILNRTTADYDKPLKVKLEL